MRDDDPKPLKEEGGVSRREFLKISGITAAVPIVVGPRVVRAAGADVRGYGPGKTPIALTVNGKKLAAELEPPLTETAHAMPAVALTDRYQGPGLGETWSNHDKRSAFVGSFAR